MHQTTRHSLYRTLAALALFLCTSARADTLNVAVASNFVSALEAIETVFEAGSAHDIQIIRGSSGKHYAQIINGAPFDVFLSADLMRPQRLLEEGAAIADSLKTYALGQLALWSREEGLALDENYLINSDNYNVIAIANPRLAPYGQAALEVFESLGIAEQTREKLVLGENIAQAVQFAYSGNADLGLIAYSQTLAPNMRNRGSVWLVPRELHQPIRQAMVLLTDSDAAREFGTFMTSPAIGRILSDSGYLLPGSSN